MMAIMIFMAWFPFPSAVRYDEHTEPRDRFCRAAGAADGLDHERGIKVCANFGRVLNRRAV
jgi:hypothetical protein